MWTQLEVFQRLDSRFRGNHKQGGNDEADAFPWSPYPKLGLNSPDGRPQQPSLTQTYPKLGYVSIQERRAARFAFLVDFTDLILN